MRGWQFPWAQLTKLRIDMAPSCSCVTHELRQVLSMLQSVEELRLTYFCAPQTRQPAARLARLRLLEITPFTPEPFSWIITPCLEHIQVGCMGDQVNEEEISTAISSLICRSCCHIRRLSILYCGITQSRMMKALASVEELFILDFPWNIQSILGVDLCIYLPKLRVLQMTCCRSIDPERDREFIAKVSRFLETRREESTSGLSHDFAPFEKLALRLHWNLDWAISHNTLEATRSWPSFVDVYVNDLLLE